MKTRASIVALTLPLFAVSTATAFAQTVTEPSTAQTQAFIHDQTCPFGQKSVGGKKGKCQPITTQDGTITSSATPNYHVHAHNQLETGITPTITNDRLHKGTSDRYVQRYTPTGTSGDDSTAGNHLRGSQGPIGTPPGITPGGL